MAEGPGHSPPHCVSLAEGCTCKTDHTRTCVQQLTNLGHTGLVAQEHSVEPDPRANIFTLHQHPACKCDLPSLHTHLLLFAWQPLPRREDFVPVVEGRVAHGPM